MLVTLALMLLAAADGGVSAPRTFTLPDVIDVVDIPGEQKALGVPMKLKALRTKLPLADAQAAMLRQFEAAGLYIPPPHHLTQTAKEPVIVALDPATLVAYAVIFQPQKDVTNVIVGTAFLARREKVGRPDWGPVYPSVKTITVTDVELLQAASYTVSVDEAEVKRFYEKVMPTGGFKKVSDGVWDKERERIQVVYSKDKDGSLRVLMTRSMTGGTE